LEGLKLKQPIILLNGVLVYDTVQQCYTQISTIAPQAACAVADILHALKINGFMSKFVDGEIITYHERLDQKAQRDFVEERMALYGKKFIQTNRLSDVSDDSIIHFSLFDEHRRLQPVHDAVSALPGLNNVFYQDSYNPEFWFLEICSDKASKQTGVAYLRQTLGYEKVVCFGDNLNDLPLFAACDVRVAVENAKPEIIAAADYICESNENDGVARWLMQQ